MASTYKYFKVIKYTVSETEPSEALISAGVYVSGRASVSTVFTSYLFLFFMNNRHEIACGQNFCLCPRRQIFDIFSDTNGCTRWKLFLARNL